MTASWCSPQSNLKMIGLLLCTNLRVYVHCITRGFHLCILCQIRVPVNMHLCSLLVVLARVRVYTTMYVVVYVLRN